MARGFAGAPTLGRRELDIRHVVVRPTDNVVFIRTHVGVLPRPRGSTTFHLLGFIRVNEHAQPSESSAWTYEVEFDRRRPREGGRLFVLDAKHHEELGCRGTADRGFKARANYDRDRITLIVPRRCLAPSRDPHMRPAWVRVTVSTLSSPDFDHLGRSVHSSRHGRAV